MMIRQLPPTLAAVTAIAAAAVAPAQTTPYYIIDGPGSGQMIDVINMTPNVSGPGATSGTVQSHGGNCPAANVTFMGTTVNTDAHFHGTLNGAADPFPFACGHGRVAPVATIMGGGGGGMPLTFDAPNGSDQLVYLNLPFIGPGQYWTGRDSRSRPPGGSVRVYFYSYDESGQVPGGPMPLPVRNQNTWLLSDDPDGGSVPDGPGVSADSFGTTRSSLFVRGSFEAAFANDALDGDLDGYLLVGRGDIDGAYLPRNYDNDIPGQNADLPIRRADDRFGDSMPPTNPLPGDINGDGDVNFGDFQRFQRSFGQTGDNLDGDFDGSGTVDFADFTILSNNFGRSAPPTPSPTDDRFGSELTGGDNQRSGDPCLVPDADVIGGDRFRFDIPAGWGPPPDDVAPPGGGDVPFVLIDVSGLTDPIGGSPCPGSDDSTFGGGLGGEIGPNCPDFNLPVIGGGPPPGGQTPDFNDALRDLYNNQNQQSIDNFREALDGQVPGAGGLVDAFIQAPTGQPLPDNVRQGLGNLQQHQQEQNLQRDSNIVRGDGRRTVTDVKDLIDNARNLSDKDKKTIKGVIDLFKPKANTTSSETRAKGNANAVRNATGNGGNAGSPTVEQKPGGVTVRNDGNGGRMTRNPNGSTVRQQPKGPTTTVSSSGIKTTRYPNGATKVEVPTNGGKDVLRTTTMPDGTVIRYNSQNGSVRTRYPDGREVTVSPNSPPRYRNWPAGQ